MTNQYIIDRKLPERSNLRFYFPNPSEGVRYFVVSLPFFENPTIKETKKARIKKYNLISRSSDLYSYLGADSRQFDLNFSITLPHVLDENTNTVVESLIGYTDMNYENSESEQKKFKTVYSTDDSNISGALSLYKKFFANVESLKDSAKQVLGSDWAQTGMTTYELAQLKATYELEGDPSLAEILNNYPAAQQGGGQKATNTATNPQNAAPNAAYSDGFIHKMKIIDLIVYWSNIIRSSVINNSKNPLYGPPIIRLRHGIMYQDIPCICMSYTLEADEIAGYDLQTLLPRRFNVSMKLEETRTGDFGEFNQNDIIAKDNLAGWESVLSKPLTMDPGYGEK